MFSQNLQILEDFFDTVSIHLIILILFYFYVFKDIDNIITSLT